MENALGLVPRALMEKLTKAVEDSDRKKIFEIIREIFIQGYNIRKFLKDYVNFFRDLIYKKVQGKDREFPSLSKEDIIRFSNMLIEGEYKLRNATNPRVFLELLLIKMSLLTHIVDIEKIMDNLSRGGIPSIESAVKKGSVTEGNNEGKIHFFIKELAKENPIFSSSVEEASSIRIEGEKLILTYKGLEGDYHIGKVMENEDEIKRIASKVFSKKIELITLKEEEKMKEEGENPKIIMLKKIFKAKEVKEE